MSEPIPWKAHFLAKLAETGKVAPAARYAGVTRQAAYLARNPRNRIGTDLAECKAFAQLWDEALLEAGDAIEEEVYKRAMNGLERQRNIYYKGKIVGQQVTRHYSDRLLMFLLEKLRPETYGEHPGQPCNHCGADPDADPLPDALQNPTDQERIETLTAELLAEANKISARKQAEKSAPTQPAEPPASSPINSEISPAFVSSPLSSAIDTSPHPAFTPETSTQNFDSLNQPSFATSNVSSPVPFTISEPAGEPDPISIEVPLDLVLNCASQISPFFPSSNVSSLDATFHQSNRPVLYLGLAPP